jgi:predicted PolB exonuclease-like 3'-5' exonuclease
MSNDMLIFLDIETLPDGPPIHPMDLKHPGQMKKAETIAEWYKNEAPAMVEEEWKKGALDSMRGRILCIGCVCDSEQEGFVICAEDEESTLRQFSAAMTGVLSLRFVGWNCNAFDIPWLWRKAIKYDIKPLRQAFNRDRFKGNSIDLMQVWASDFKDYRKQSDVAKFLGIEDRSNGIDGSQVYDLYKEGRIEEIKTYCMGDVLTVRDIYNRIYE